MTSKYPKASLWRMKKVELLLITDSEPTLKADKEMTRAELIAEILTIESEAIPMAVVTEAPVQSLPALPEYEEEDLTPASARIQRIRQANK